MEEVIMCRICLVMDVKMYDLQSHPLSSYFGFVTGSNLLTIVNSPPYACYECAALVKKFYLFKQKSLKSQDLLNGLIDSNKKIAPSKLKLIDRQDLRLCSNLNTYFVPDGSVPFLNACKTIKGQSIENFDGHTINSQGSEMITNEEPIIENSASRLALEFQVAKIKKEPIVINIESNVVTNLQAFETTTKEGLIESIKSNFVVNSHASEIITKEELIVEHTESHFATNTHISETIIKEEPIAENKEGDECEDLATYFLTSEMIIEEKSVIDARSIKITNVKQEQQDVASPKKIMLSGDGRLRHSLRERKCKTDPKDKKDKNDNSSNYVVIATKKKQMTLNKKLIDVIKDHVTITKLTIKEQIEEMMKRKNSSIYLNSPYKCNQCYKGFSDAVTRYQHLQKHSPKAGMVECSICNIWYKLKNSLKRHMARHELKYACKYCPYVSSLPNQAKHHLGQHKGVTYACKLCGEVFTVRTSFLSHMRRLHPPEFICDVCGYSYVTKKGLETHKYLTHKGLGTHKHLTHKKGLGTHKYLTHKVTMTQDSEGKEHEADGRIAGSTKHTSKKSFKSQVYLEVRPMQGARHVKKPSRRRWPVKCELCSEVIQNGRDHWYHYKKKHPDKRPVEKSYLCDYCDKTFVHKSGLLEHTRTHTGERPYKCTQCDKAFGKLYNLQQHEQRHNDICAFICDVCKKAFKFKYALKRHLLGHSDVRPSCDICHATFANTRNCKMHVNNIHSKRRTTKPKQSDQGPRRTDEA